MITDTLIPARTPKNRRYRPVRERNRNVSAEIARERARARFDRLSPVPEWWTKDPNSWTVARPDEAEEGEVAA